MAQNQNSDNSFGKTQPAILVGGRSIRVNDLDKVGATTGQVLTYNGTAVVWGTGSNFSLPATETDSTTTTTTSLAFAMNAVTTGVGISISTTALTTGINHQSIATAATLTTGRYYSANDSTTEVFGIGLNGHIISTQTTAPTIAVGTQNGITAAAITAGSTDTCGSITTTGTSTGGTIMTVTFNKTYTTAPKVVQLTAANAAGGGVNSDPYISSITATTFVITIPTGGVYAATPSWYYLVIA